VTNYRDILTPSQAEEMGRFLFALTEGAELCKQIGVKPDIRAAMTAWGHVPQTEEEHNISNGFRAREKKAEAQRKGETK
jgi:hypothetical protein